MKCVNCQERTKCLLCGDCWRLAVVSPVAVLLVERLLRHLWP